MLQIRESGRRMVMRKLVTSQKAKVIARRVRGATLSYALPASNSVRCMPLFSPPPPLKLTKANSVRHFFRQLPPACRIVRPISSTWVRMLEFFGAMSQFPCFRTRYDWDLSPERTIFRSCCVRCTYFSPLQLAAEKVRTIQTKLPVTNHIYFPDETQVT